MNIFVRIYKRVTGKIPKFCFGQFWEFEDERRSIEGCHMCPYNEECMFEGKK